MPQQKSSLSLEFNATAKAHFAGGIPFELLPTKYAILSRAAAFTLEDRQAVANTVYDHAVQWLAGIAKPGATLWNGMDATVTSVTPLFTEETAAGLLPGRTPERLAEAALALLRRAEQPKDLDWADQKRAVNLAKTVLDFADRLAGLQQRAPARREDKQKKPDDGLNL